MWSSIIIFFFFKQKTAYEMRISDWSSDVCSSDLHGLADAGAAEQADLAALGVGREQIDDLDAGDEDRAVGRLIDEQRGGRVDRRGFGRADGAEFVDRLTDHVEDAAQRLGTDGHADLRAGVGDDLTAREAGGRIHRDRAHGVLAEMLRDRKRRVGKECVSTCRSRWSPYH